MLVGYARVSTQEQTSTLQRNAFKNTGYARFFSETGHNRAGSFLSYWTANGGLLQFGYLISEEFVETLDDSKPYVVQYFERARFEHHPENQLPYDVLLGQIARRILEGR